MTFRLGLTGSIGAGKTTTAHMFRDLRVPVWDADATVHTLYARGGPAEGPVGALVPDAVAPSGLDRAILRAAVTEDPELLPKIERIVHPLVAADRMAFTRVHPDAPLLVFDIPLLFETGGDKAVDAVLVVTTDPETRKARAMARPGMTDAVYENLSARQMPDAEKRARADHVIETRTLDRTRADVADLVRSLTEAGDR